MLPYFWGMPIIETNQPWQLRPLNQSGIRRIKLVSADTLKFFPSAGLVPQTSFVFYEFIFPSDLPCIATVQQQESPTGQIFFAQSISFSLPHFSDLLIQWIARERNTDWLVIAEDNNEITRLFGGVPDGLRLSLQGNTGAGRRDTNPISFSLTGQQLTPYTLLADYQDQILFPNNAGFSYGFSTGFNS
ncbi:hypothetical protein [Dyadobacter sp.]|uniref:hypothetical protein n=1 Tax=Dyadobacter sp. TaxID=1914288 RepID=UPI003F702326